MPQAPTIDTHAHYFPQSYIDLIAKHGPRCGTTVSQDASGRTFIQVGLLLRTGPIVPLFIDLDARLKEMDRQGVKVHVLSLTQPMVYWADDDLGHAAFGGVQRRDQRRTSQRIPTGCSASRRCRSRIPSSRWKNSNARRSCPASAASTSRRRCATAISPTRSFFPIYARMEALGLPLFLHPMMINNERMKQFYLINLCGNPFETALAASHLIYGGVLDAFPKLEVACPTPAARCRSCAGVSTAVSTRARNARPSRGRRASTSSASPTTRSATTRTFFRTSSTSSAPTGS